jgi:hypothetical protein
MGILLRHQLSQQAIGEATSLTVGMQRIADAENAAEAAGGKPSEEPNLKVESLKVMNCSMQKYVGFHVCM